MWARGRNGVALVIGFTMEPPAVTVTPMLSLRKRKLQ